MPDQLARRVDEAPQPQMQTVLTRFSNANNRQRNLLEQLEDRLHKIHNKRGPEKSPTPKEIPISNDSIQSLHDELNRFDNENDTLEKLVSHISEII